MSDRADGLPKAMLGFVLLVAFLDNFGQFPVLAPLAHSLGAGPFLAGLILGAYSLSNLVGNLLVGPVLDRRGPAGPLALSLLATAAVLSGYAFAASPERLLALRLFHGLVAAAIVPAVFVMATGRTRRSGGKGSALGRTGALGAVIGVAAMAGPPGAGVLARVGGFPLVYLSLAVLFAVAALLVGTRSRRQVAPATPRLRADPPSRLPPDEGGAGDVGPARPIRSVVTTAAATGLLETWAGAAALVFGVGSVALLLPLSLAEATAEAAALEAGKLLALFSLAATCVMGIVARLRGEAPPEIAMSIGGIGLLGMAVSLGGLASPIAGFPFALPGFLVLLGIGFGLAFPALSAGVALRSHPHARGRAYGVFYACFSAGAFLGPSVAGVAGTVGTDLGAGYLPAVVVTGAVGIAALRRGRREGREGGLRAAGGA